MRLQSDMPVSQTMQWRFITAAAHGVVYISVLLDRVQVDLRLGFVCLEIFLCS